MGLGELTAKLTTLKAGVSDNVKVDIAKLLAEYLEVDEVIVGLDQQYSNSDLTDALTVPWTFNAGTLKAEDQNLPLPLIISDSNRSLKAPAVLNWLRTRGVRSAALLALENSSGVFGWIYLATNKQYRRFIDELNQLEAIAGILSGVLAPVDKPKSTTLTQQFRYQKLLSASNSIIIRTDRDFSISEVLGDCKKLLGITAEELVRAGSTVWTKLLPLEDRARLQRILKRMRSAPIEFSEEFEVLNLESSESRWLIIRGIPIIGADRKLKGWEGIGIDVTAKHIAEDALKWQRQRVEALYEVSSALQLNLDPSLVTLRGLRALIRATGSNSGIGFSYSPDSDSLELVAAEGVTSQYIEAVEQHINDRSLVRHAVETKAGLLIHDIQNDNRAAVKVASIEGLRSTIVMPLLLDSRCLGAIVIFCREAGVYNEDDFDLVSAAANQIALATYQAELYANEKRQASSFAALYRLSHELTTRSSLKEIAEQSFTILHEELACKRMWLGVLNEQGTHLVGQGGFGPGVRRRIAEVQIELSLRHDFLDQAIATKQPIVVYPEQPMECSGLQAILEKLSPGPFAVVPLVSLSHVVGVILIEPSIAAGFFSRSKLNFLNSLASEIATAIMARRFENRVAEAEKMRMAGLLASGVAHNFNNLLQAVMGQASLLEIQLAKDSTAARSSQMIKNAAQRGANLVRQLLTLAQDEPHQKKHFSLHSFLSDSVELYRSILGSSIRFELNAPIDLPDVNADYSQIQQVMTNILMNSRDAILGSDGVVTVEATVCRLKSSEVDPELPPGFYVRIGISDNGVGMDQEKLSRCFEPFFTTKNIDPVTGIGVGGSGLGLSSAYLIMKRHGGLITVNSQLTKGSTFTLYLPAIHKSINESKADKLLQDQVEIIAYDNESPELRTDKALVRENRSGNTQGASNAKERSKV